MDITHLNPLWGSKFLYQPLTFSQSPLPCLPETWNITCQKRILRFPILSSPWVFVISENGTTIHQVASARNPGIILDYFAFYPLASHQQVTQTPSSKCVKNLTPSRHPSCSFTRLYLGQPPDWPPCFHLTFHSSFSTAARGFVFKPLLDNMAPLPEALQCIPIASRIKSQLPPTALLILQHQHLHIFSSSFTGHTGLLSPSDKVIPFIGYASSTFCI